MKLFVKKKISLFQIDIVLEVAKLFKIDEFKVEVKKNISDGEKELYLNIFKDKLYKWWYKSWGLFGNLRHPHK